VLHSIIQGFVRSLKGVPADIKEIKMIIKHNKEDFISNSSFLTKGDEEVASDSLGNILNSRRTDPYFMKSLHLISQRILKHK